MFPPPKFFKNRVLFFLGGKGPWKKGTFGYLLGCKANCWPNCFVRPLTKLARGFVKAAFQLKIVGGRQSLIPVLGPSLSFSGEVIGGRRRLGAWAKRATPASDCVQCTDDPVKLGWSRALPAGRQCDRRAFSFIRACRKAIWTDSRTRSHRRTDWGPGNPNNPNLESVTTGLRATAQSVGVQIEVVRATDSPAIEAAFAKLQRSEARALLVAADPFFFSRRVQLATLAARYAMPAVYNVREYAEVGGLISYGTSLMEVFRQVGAYTALILKGAKPADLPVVQSTKFELIINGVTARAIGVEIPPTLLARADEVIE